jgi:CRISPR/Cas system-associated endonuclease/helicase Cas3
MENTLKNKLTKTTTSNEIDYASIEALTAINNLMQELTKANKKLIEKEVTKEQETFDMEEYSANTIAVDKLLQARAIINQISNNCLNKYLD